MWNDPEAEVRRMEAVRRYDILDTPPDGSFDRLTALAARMCDAPMAVISIVDTDRIWFKSHHGLAAGATGRDPGLCASAILQDGPWIVEDARADPRALANPLVAGELGLAFYLGIPLTTNDGHNLGTLCVLDIEPRRASEREVADMIDLAAIVMDELELRRAAQRRLADEAARRREAEELARVLQESLLPASLPHLDGIELAVRYLPADRARVGGDFYDALTTETGVLLLVGDVQGHGPAAAALTSMGRHTLRAVATGGWSPAQSLTTLSNAIAGLQAGDVERRFCTVAAVRIDPKESGWSVTASLGGHPQPLLVRADGTITEVGAPGPMLGWLDDPCYHDVTVEAGAGDFLLLYTDGLTDAHPGAPKPCDGSLARLLDGVADKPANAIADALLGAATAFTSAPRDDIALLVARFVGNGG